MKTFIGYVVTLIVGLGLGAYVKDQAVITVKMLIDKFFAWIDKLVGKIPGPPAVGVIVVAILALGVPPHVACQTAHHGDLTFGPSTTPGVSYNVYRSIGSTPLASKTLVKSGLLTTSYSDTPLAANTNYCWQVTAVSSTTGESSPTNEACGSTDKDQAGTPGTLTVVVK